MRSKFIEYYSYPRLGTEDNQDRENGGEEPHIEGNVAYPTIGTVGAEQEITEVQENQAYVGVKLNWWNSISCTRILCMQPNLA